MLVDTFIVNTIIEGGGDQKARKHNPTIRLELWPRLLGESQLRQSKIHSGWII